MINEAVALVRNFHVEAKQPVSDRPVLLSSFQVERRIRWIKKELDELKEAGSVEQQADAITDCLYYLLGCFVEIGVEPDPLFQIIHKANMEKLHNCRVDDDGRVLKPEGWNHPDEEIRKAIEEMKGGD